NSGPSWTLVTSYVKKAVLPSGLRPKGVTAPSRLLCQRGSKRSRRIRRSVRESRSCSPGGGSPAAIVSVSAPSLEYTGGTYPMASVNGGRFSRPVLASKNRSAPLLSLTTSVRPFGLALILNGRTPSGSVNVLIGAAGLRRSVARRVPSV